MARSFDECVSSSLQVLRGQCKGHLQLCADAAEAIPTTYGAIAVGIRTYATRIDRSPKTVERWRDTGLAWSSVMTEFPPQGGFSKVDYTVYRDLPAKFGGDTEKAFAFLTNVVENEKLVKEVGRWTRTAVFALLPKSDTGSRTTVAEEAQTNERSRADEHQPDSETGESQLQGDGEAGPDDQLALYDDLRDRTGGTGGAVTDEDETGEAGLPENRIRLHLKAVEQEIPNLGEAVWGARADQLARLIDRALVMVDDVLYDRIETSTA